MHRFIAAVLLAVTANAVTAESARPAAVFGAQLDCATKKALNSYGQVISEISRVRRAVDSCISGSMTNEARIVHTSTRTTLTVLEARREDLVGAVMRRLQLCRDTGINAAKFAAACPQMFALERIQLD